MHSEQWEQGKEAPSSQLSGKGRREQSLTEHEGDNQGRIGVF